MMWHTHHMYVGREGAHDDYSHKLNRYRWGLEIVHVVAGDANETPHHYQANGWFVGIYNS